MYNSSHHSHPVLPLPNLSFLFLLTWYFVQTFYVHMDLFPHFFISNTWHIFALILIFHVLIIHISCLYDSPRNSCGFLSSLVVSHYLRLCIYLVVVYRAWAWATLVRSYLHMYNCSVFLSVDTYSLPLSPLPSTHYKCRYFSVKNCTFFVSFKQASVGAVQYPKVRYCSDPRSQTFF